MIPHFRPAHVLRGSKGPVAWWGALVAILAFAVVAKTGTVGAPVLARTHPDAAPAARPVLFAAARARAARAQALAAAVALVPRSGARPASGPRAIGRRVPSTTRTGEPASLASCRRL